MMHLSLIVWALGSAAQAGGQLTADLHLGRVGGGTTGMPELAERFTFSGMLLGGAMGLRSGPDDRPPAFDMALGMQGLQRPHAKADGEPLQPEPGSAPDPVIKFSTLRLHATVAPGVVEAGPVSLAPQFGLAITFPSYLWNFALAPFSTNFDDTSDLYANNYGDFYGVSAGSWWSLSKLLGEARLTWSPFGPSMAKGVPPTEIRSVPGYVSKSDRVQGGQIVGLDLDVEWTGIKGLVPGLRYAGQTWKVVTDGVGGSFAGTSRSGYSAIYLTLGIRMKL